MNASSKIFLSITLCLNLNLIEVLSNDVKPIIIVHGGAGDIPQNRVQGKLDGVRLAVRAGYDQLVKGGSALDAVEAAVVSMEKDDNFNAGMYLLISPLTNGHFFRCVIIVLIYSRLWFSIKYKRGSCNGSKYHEWN